MNAEAAYDLNITLNNTFKFYNNVYDPFPYAIDSRFFDHG
jgi:hypothetical protein